ncbi:nuclear hormone receptor HR96 [Wyeomyia smithii]|uniref:nuclear hormone receptor HR96 n=1 Tax=Wyeomyia smithii TaxID=174621 RepID=UPI002467D939|nr:nuclear hormone receptor HR96 [Wyeomyia smithii]
MSTETSDKADSVGAMSSSSGASKVCSVCGDKALGYNFNAMTCESCKAFFRRNALSTKSFTCPFSESCEITVVTRRFCQKCRLDKCFQIGMKKEYIMSEEDKALKRHKIEQNRAKKRMINGSGGSSGSGGGNSNDGLAVPTGDGGGIMDSDLPMKIKREGSDSDCWSNSPSDYIAAEMLHRNTGLAAPNANVFNGVPSVNEIGNSSTSSQNNLIHTNQTMDGDLLSVISVLPSQPNDSLGAKPALNSNELLLPVLSLESSATEIVNRIVNYPTLANQTIASLMKTPKDAVFIMSKVINSQCDALKLISHFITAPGDALQIISKIMNSPLDALTVFAQFMSSPTDALQIIGKIMSSPAEVLHFMQQLMNQPEDAVQIMNKFMNAPAEALQMINKMMNHSDSDVLETIKEAADTSSSLRENDEDPRLETIRSLIESQSIPVLPSETASPSSTSQICEPSLSPLPFDPFLLNGPSEEANGDHRSSPVSNLPREPPLDTELFQDIEGHTVLPNTLESILMQAIRLEYEGYNGALLGSTGSGSSSSSQQHQHPAISGNSIELNDPERAKLNELIVANKALYAPVDEDLASLISDDCRIKSNKNQHDPLLLKVINLTAIAIRRLIKMSKKISAFKNMCQEDQLALLKAGCTEMMILRSAMQYDCDRASWKIPHSQEEMSNIRADILKLAKGNVYQEHERFIRTFDKKWRSDENIILIMCAITLFTPDRPKTVHSDVIKLEQNSYYYLLRRYLESIYPGCEARSIFLKLMQKISELHRLNDEIISVYLDVNPAQVEPLLREIFDLKVQVH